MDNSADSSSHPFRDGTAGAEARRLKLLRDRRDELATMSHEIRQIYVKRFSRLLAASALALGGSIIVAASLNEGLANSISELLPGKNPAALSTMLLAAWVVAGFALFSGRAWAERRFAVAMSKAVLPTDEVHTDVSRLACEDPATVGRAITRRLVPISRMVSILASGLILPVTGLALYLVVQAEGYPLVDDVEDLFAEQAVSLVLIASMAVLLSLRLALASNWRPSFFTALGAAILLPGVLAIAPEFALPVLIGCALLGTTAFLNYRRRSQEDARIEQTGAPVPPVIHFRKRIAQLWSLLWSFTHIFRWSSWKASGRALKGAGKRCIAFRPSVAQWMSAAVLVTASVGTILFYADQCSAEECEAQAADFSTDTGDDADGEDIDEDAVSYSFLNEGDLDAKEGAYVDFVFYNGAAVDATEHLGNAFIPHGWRASVMITRVTNEGDFQVEALPGSIEGSTSRWLSDASPVVTFENTNCSGQDIPLVFKVEPGINWSRKLNAALRYDVQLDLITSCL